jgi:hypothetical protein
MEYLQTLFFVNKTRGRKVKKYTYNFSKAEQNCGLLARLVAFRVDDPSTDP